MVLITDSQASSSDRTDHDTHGEAGDENNPPIETPASEHGEGEETHNQGVKDEDESVDLVKVGATSKSVVQASTPSLA